MRPTSRVSTFSLPIIALVIAGCVHLPTYTLLGHPTAPMPPRASSAPIAAGDGRVVVLSPGFFETLLSALPELADKVDRQSQSAPSGVALVHEYHAVTAAFERRLIDGGLRPVTSETIREALRDPEVRARIRTLAEGAEDGISLQQLSRAIGPAVSASLALVVRSSRIAFVDDPTVVFPEGNGCAVVRLQPLQVAIDALLVEIDSGEIVWSGEADLRTSDLFPESVEFPRGPAREPFTRDYGPFRIVGQNDGSRCGITMFAGYYCWESGTNSGHCHANEEPAYPEAIAHLVDEVVQRLVATMNVRSG